MLVFDGPAPAIKRRQALVGRRKRRAQAALQLEKTRRKVLLARAASLGAAAAAAAQSPAAPQPADGKAGASKAPLPLPPKPVGPKAVEETAFDAYAAAGPDGDGEGDGEGGGPGADARSAGDSDWDVELPDGEIDPAVVAALPAAVQYRVIQRRMRQEGERTRSQFQAVADKDPSMFSELQLNKFLKSGSISREIAKVCADGHFHP